MLPVLQTQAIPVYFCLPVGRLHVSQLLLCCVCHVFERGNANVTTYAFQVLCNADADSCYFRNAAQYGSQGLGRMYMRMSLQFVRC